MVQSNQCSLVVWCYFSSVSTNFPFHTQNGSLIFQLNIQMSQTFHLYITYSGFLFKWERYIQMRMAYLVPILSLLPLFFGGRKEASRKLSFEWKILIWIGHYSNKFYILVLHRLIQQEGQSPLSSKLPTFDSLSQCRDSLSLRLHHNRSPGRMIHHGYTMCLRVSGNLKRKAW